MTTMLERLKRKIASSSKEEILRKWNSGNEWDSCGPKVRDFMNEISFHLEADSPEKHFENVEIYNNLGSKTFSNLFYFSTNAINHSFIPINRLSFFQSHA